MRAASYSRQRRRQCLNRSPIFTSSSGFPWPRCARRPCHHSGPRSMIRLISYRQSHVGSCSILTTTLAKPPSTRRVRRASDELVHVGHVQATVSSSSTYSAGAGAFCRAKPDIVAHLGQLGHQLDALGLAARQRGRWLAQGSDGQAHVFSQLAAADGQSRHGRKNSTAIDTPSAARRQCSCPPGDGQVFGLSVHRGRPRRALSRRAESSSRWCAHALAFTQAGQRPSPVLNEKGQPPSRGLGLQGLGQQLANGVLRSRYRWPGSCGVLPIGVWSTSSTRSMVSKPLAGPAAGSAGRLACIHGGIAPGLGQRAAAPRRPHWPASHRAPAWTPERTPVTGHQAFERNRAHPRSAGCADSRPSPSASASEGVAVLLHHISGSYRFLFLGFGWVSSDRRHILVPVQQRLH